MSSPREVFFDEAEYAARVGRVQARLAEEGIDLVITPAPGNICYLAGYFSGNVLDIMFLAIPAAGRPVFYLWQFEEGRAEASLVGAELVCWDTGVEPIGFVIADLRRRGLAKGQVCVDTGSTHTPYDVVHRLLGGLDASPRLGLIEEVRLVKSPAEHALIRTAAAKTDAGVGAALAAIEAGATDMTITGAAYAALMAEQSEPLCIDPFVAVGWRSGSPHSTRGGGIAGPGDPVFVELSGVVGRYNAPLMRTRVVGEPSAELQALADASNACLDAIIAVMRDGLAISEIAKVARPALEPVASKIIFHYLYGYPVGVGFPPNWIESNGNYLSADNPRALRAGMVYHLPLMLRVKGRYGAGFSETVIVGTHGVEVLSKIPRRLTA